MYSNCLFSCSQMWTCILCPPLIYLLIRYRVDDRQQLTDEAPQNKALRKKKKVWAYKCESLYPSYRRPLPFSYDHSPDTAQC